jgi:hypothetical protein
MVRRKGIFVVAAVVAWAVPHPLQAYWAVSHVQMNTQIAKAGQPFTFSRAGHDIKTVDDYLKLVLLVDQGLSAQVKGVPFQDDFLFRSAGYGSDQPTDDPSKTMSLADWNSKGALWEDGFDGFVSGAMWAGLRAVNHFHNPTHPSLSGPGGDGGYSGFTFSMNTPTGGVDPRNHQAFAGATSSGISAIRWAACTSAHDPSGCGNAWGFPTAANGLSDFLLLAEASADPNMSNRDKQERGLANAMRAIGQVEHLIEDNSVPDHSRDNPHPGSGYEEWVGDNASFTIDPSSFVPLPLQSIENAGLAGFWSQNIYNGGSATVTWQSGNPPVGISEFSQANFFAWSDFSAGMLFEDVKRIFQGQPLFVHAFSTLPPGIDMPGDSCADAKKPLCVPFNWPQLGVGFKNGYWTPLVGTSLDVVPIAFGPDNRGKYRTDYNCWQAYSGPLLNRAYGYAQSALALLLPPVYAEIVPDVSGPLTNAKVRIRNLGPTPSSDMNSPNDGVTWHLTSASVKPIQPYKVDTPETPNSGAAFQITDAPGVDVEPGTSSTWESQAFTLTTSQQYGLDWASHTAIEIEANVGTGLYPPKLKFGFVIPSAFVDIEQTETINQSTTPAMADTTTSCPPQCDLTCSTACGQVAASINANVQEVKGNITLYPTKLDALGRPAGSDTYAAMQLGAHLAAVAIVDIPGDGSMENAVLPNAAGTKLTLVSTGGSDVALQQPDSTVPFYVRDAQIDEADEPSQWTFDATIDVGALANQLTAVSNQKVYLASDTLVLAAWTTGGQLWVQKLALWTIPTTLATANQVTNPCQPQVDGTASAFASCSSSSTPTGPMNMCTTSPSGTFSSMQQSTLKTTLGDIFEAPDPRMATLFPVMFRDLKLDSVAGMTPSTLPVCPNPLSGTGVCLDPTGPVVAYSSAQQQSGSGGCGAISSPGLQTLSASYESQINLLVQTIWQIALGRGCEPLPSPTPFNMH